jgi:hypothetical protein
LAKFFLFRQNTWNVAIFDTVKLFSVHILAKSKIVQKRLEARAICVRFASERADLCGFPSLSLSLPSSLTFNLVMSARGEPFQPGRKQALSGCRLLSFEAFSPTTRNAFFNAKYAANRLSAVSLSH